MTLFDTMAFFFFFFFVYYHCGAWASLCLTNKESSCNAGDMGLIPGSGRSPGEENGNPLQYNPMDTGAWRAAVHWGTKE